MGRAPPVPRSFLERFLDFKPGELYSYAKTYQTQFNLINSDRFASVRVREAKEEARDFRVPVKIQLEDSASQRLRPGVGYATDTGARFSLRYQDLNVFPPGHDFSADLTVGERRRALSALYTFPSPGHIDNRTILKTGLLQEIVKPYDTWSFTLEAERARSLRERAGWAPPTSSSGRRIFRSRPGGKVHPDFAGSSFFPAAGGRYRPAPQRLSLHLETRGSTDILGAETNFAQFLGNGDLLIPLPYEFSLIPRVQVGATWQRNAVTDLPPSLRFYAGGDRSVRGYTYQSLGPKDASGNVIGGKNLLVGSMELEYALRGKLGDRRLL